MSTKIVRQLTEAESPVPPEHPLGTPPKGRRYPPMPPPRLRHSADPDDPSSMDLGGGPGDDIKRVMGRAPGGPPAQFNPKELSMLKDVMILMLANLARSDMDKQIGQALMTGQPLDPGLLQHILDEARNLELPETHGTLMQKIHSQLGQR